MLDGSIFCETMSNYPPQIFIDDRKKTFCKISDLFFYTEPIGTDISFMFNLVNIFYKILIRKYPRNPTMKRRQLNYYLISSSMYSSSAVSLNEKFLVLYDQLD